MSHGKLLMYLIKSRERNGRGNSSVSRIRSKQGRTNDGKNTNETNI